MKRNKTLRMLIAFAMTLMLCLSSVTTALADDPMSKGDEAAPAEAAITKVLQMPMGTDTPAVTFTFEFEKVSVDNDAAKVADVPTVADKTIAFVATNVGTTDTTTRIKTVALETATDIFDGITFPYAGFYTYRVTEAQSSNINNSDAQTINYSVGSYLVTAWVDNNAAGTGTYVKAITSKVEVKDNEGQTLNAKVDPTPGGDSATYFTSQMIFTNTYLKNNGGTTSSDSVLAISKTVAGASGNKSKYFAFNVELTAAALLPTSPATTYKVYLMEGGSAIAFTSDNYAGTPTDEGGINYIEVTAGTPIDVNLKHGQSLSVANAHVGTTYTITETGAANYTPEVNVIVGGGSPVNSDAAAGADLTITDELVGDGANSAAFTNTAGTVAPTGITLNNLPFVLMIALALGAMVLFVVAKSRRRVHSH